MVYQGLEHPLCIMEYAFLDGIITTRIIVTKNLKNWIKAHEGFRSYPYLDSAGKVTIGYGRNIDTNGISKLEADLLFDNDLIRCRMDLIRYDWYALQPQNVQDALLNMCFNLGINKLLGFKKMIEALIVMDYTRASIEIMDSKWALQVGIRAKDVALMMRQG